jgi:hypothetical protein
MNGVGSTGPMGISSSLSSLLGNGDGEAACPKLKVESSSSSGLRPKPMLNPPGELSDFRDGSPTDSIGTAPSESSKQKKLSTETLGLTRLDALAKDQPEASSRV